MSGIRFIQKKDFTPWCLCAKNIGILWKYSNATRKFDRTTLPLRYIDIHSPKIVSVDFCLSQFSVVNHHGFCSRNSDSPTEPYTISTKEFWFFFFVVSIEFVILMFYNCQMSLNIIVCYQMQTIRFNRDFHICFDWMPNYLLLNLLNIELK